MAVEKNISPPKRSFLRNALLFAIIIMIVATIWFAWSRYLSPTARTSNEMEQNYAAYQEWERQYNQALAEDTYGGATPEETLQLFIEALEQEDVELASKYFMINPDTIDPNKSQEKWRDGLQVKKEQNELGLILENLKTAIPSERDLGDENKVEYIVMGNGTIEHSIIFKFNPTAVIWKIEEM